MTLQFTERLHRVFQPPHTVSRPVVANIDDGLVWLRGWHDEDGRHVWMASSDRERRHAVKHWLFVRWCHRAALVQRGGRDV